MADTFKVLAQSNPAATTLTDAYTAPANAFGVIISSIVVANRGGSTLQYRISVAVAGAADDNKQYLFYDVELLKRTSHVLVLGITLTATDKIRVQSTVATASFNIFGAETTSAP